MNRIQRLEHALKVAIAWGEEGWGYASDYFRHKWRYEEHRKELRDVLPVGLDEALPCALEDDTGEVSSAQQELEAGFGADQCSNEATAGIIFRPAGPACPKCNGAGAVEENGQRIFCAMCRGTGTEGGPASPYRGTDYPTVEYHYRCPQLHEGVTATLSRALRCPTCGAEIVWTNGFINGVPNSWRVGDGVSICIRSTEAGSPKRSDPHG